MKGVGVEKEWNDVTVGWDNVAGLRKIVGPDG